MITTRKQLRALANENGFLFCKNRKTPSVKIYEDGSIVRADVSLELCKEMTVKEAVQLLKL